MPQGFKYSLVIDGDQFDWKRITVDDGGTELDISSKILPSGAVNVSADGSRAFSVTEGGLATLSFNCYGLLSDTNIAFLVAFTPITLYDVTWAISYDGTPLYAGSSFFFQRAATDADFEGVAGMNMFFKSSGLFSYP